VCLIWTKEKKEDKNALFFSYLLPAGDKDTRIFARFEQEEPIISSIPEVCWFARCEEMIECWESKLYSCIFLLQHGKTEYWNSIQRNSTRSFSKLNMLPPAFSTKNNGPDNTKRFLEYVKVFNPRFNILFVGPWKSSRKDAENVV